MRYYLLSQPNCFRNIHFGGKTIFLLVGFIVFLTFLATLSQAAEFDDQAKDFILWHPAEFMAVNGSYSAWCGSMSVRSCVADDMNGGYGPNYDEVLEWRGTVDFPTQPCTISLDASINIDTMPGYDYFIISFQTAEEEEVDLLFKDGLEKDIPVSVEFTYQPGDYVGQNGDEVVIQFRVISDGGWDGQDCLWPNDGAVQLDDVVIALSNGEGYSHDFEDGTLGELVVPGALSGLPEKDQFSVSVFPNPFNPNTSISYTIDQPGYLSVMVYDLQGRLVQTLQDGPVMTSGEVIWDGTGQNGVEVPSGVYFYQARLGAELEAGKMVLIK